MFGLGAGLAIAGVGMLVGGIMVGKGMSDTAQATKYGFDKQKEMNIATEQIKANAQIKEALINQEIATADRQYSREWDKRADAQADKFFNQIDRLTEDSIDDIHVERSHNQHRGYDLPEPTRHI